MPSFFKFLKGYTNTENTVSNFLGNQSQPPFQPSNDELSHIYSLYSQNYKQFNDVHRIIFLHLSTLDNVYKYVRGVYVILYTLDQLAPLRHTGVCLPFDELELDEHDVIPPASMFLHIRLSLLEIIEVLKSVKWWGEKVEANNNNNNNENLPNYSKDNDGEYTQVASFSIGGAIQSPTSEQNNNTTQDEKETKKKSDDEEQKKIVKLPPGASINKQGVIFLDDSYDIESKQQTRTSSSSNLFLDNNNNNNNDRDSSNLLNTNTTTAQYDPLNNSNNNLGTVGSENDNNNNNEKTIDQVIRIPNSFIVGLHELYTKHDISVQALTTTLIDFLESFNTIHNPVIQNNNQTNNTEASFIIPAAPPPKLIKLPTAPPPKINNNNNNVNNNTDNINADNVVINNNNNNTNTIISNNNNNIDQFPAYITTDNSNPYADETLFSNDHNNDNNNIVIDLKEKDSAPEYDVIL